MKALAVVGRYLVRTYATVDPRSLAVFRMMLGAILFMDVARRWPDLEAHYSNAGWLTNHFALYRPMSSHLFSLYHAFSQPVEVKAMVVAHLFVNLCLIVGWQTRLMQILAALLITSINSRNIMLENGGWVVLILLSVWTIPLPLARRFSVDAWIRSWRERREGTIEALNDRSSPGLDVAPIVSLAVTALVAQWVVIYVFNVVHKSGQPWKDGTAVYYFFQQDRMVTQLGVFVRQHMPLAGIKLLTHSTLYIESGIAILMVLPFWTRWTRKLAFVLAVLLHGSIDAVVQLGPFSWAMVAVFLIYLTPQDWEWIEKKLAQRSPERTLAIDAQNGLALTFARAVKRKDWLGRVRFEALPVPAPEIEKPVVEQAAEAAPPAEPPPPAPAELLTVADTTGKTFTGRESLQRLADALFPPRLLVSLLFPLFGGLLARALRSATARRDEAQKFFGLEALPGTDWQAPPPSDARVFFRNFGSAIGNVLVLLVMVASGSQVLIENRAVPESLKPARRPDWMTAIVIYPRMFQGWSMFAPAPPTEDGRMVVDGRTSDGRHLDVFTGREPNYEVQPKDGFRMNQIWGDFHRRIGEPRFSAYLPGVRDMLLNYHQITGRPQDRLIAFDLWYVVESIPPPGQPPRPAQKRKLMSHGVVR